MTADKRSPEDQAKLVEAITDLFEHKITFNEFLGFKILQLEQKPVQIGFDMRSELIGHYQHGRLHGGVISSVLDATGGLAVMWAITEYHQGETAMQTMARFRNLGTIDLRVDYLRQGIGSRFVAEGEVVRLGRRIASVAMRLENEDGTLIATGNATYIVS